MINVTHVELGTEEEELVLSVLRSGQLAQGPMVSRLEESFAGLVGTRHAVALNSGTTALVATLQGLGIGAGDVVVTSPFTFVATLNAVIETGATARFADITLDDFTLDVKALEAVITTGPVRAIIPVHLYGQAADMPRVAALARAHGALVVEDAAQALGAEIEGRQVGTFGPGCFSLYATKNITTGEGGVVTTDDDDLADRLRVLRNQGMRHRYQYDVPGHNYRMTDLHAAVGLPQLRRLGEITKRRRENADRLTEGLAGVSGLVTPVVRPGRTHVFHQYTVRVTEDAGVTRDELAQALADRGIGTGVYYPRLVFDYPCYLEHPLVVTAEAPAARRAAGEVLSLPVHPALTAGDLERIVEAVREVLGA